MPRPAQTSIPRSNPEETVNASQTPVGYDGESTWNDLGGSDTGLIVGVVLDLLTSFSVCSRLLRTGDRVSSIRLAPWAIQRGGCQRMRN
jgi:hypothetical protein